MNDYFMDNFSLSLEEVGSVTYPCFFLKGIALKAEVAYIRSCKKEGLDLWVKIGDSIHCVRGYMNNNLSDILNIIYAKNIELYYLSEKNNVVKVDENYLSKYCIW